MSLLKSELKQLVTTEIGVRVEDALELAKRDLTALEARKAAFQEGSNAVEALMAAVDRDVDEAKFDPPTSLIVKRYLERSVNALRNMSLHSQNQMIAQAGKVQGLQQTVSLLQAIIDDEKKKAEQMRAAVAAQVTSSPALAQSSVDVRPPPSIKEQRLAEEGAERAASEQKAQEAPEAPKVAEQAAAPVAVEQVAEQAESAQAAQITHWKQRGKKSRASNT
jgi:hypothetical protein